MLQLVPYQRTPTPPMDEALRAACQRAMHVLTRDGRRLRAGRAALFVLEAVGYRRFARVMRLVPLVWLVELGYRIVAGNRRLFSRFLFRKEKRKG